MIPRINAQIILHAPSGLEPQIFRNGVPQIFRNHHPWDAASHSGTVNCCQVLATGDDPIFSS
jgi:hypothetical protein